MDLFKIISDIEKVDPEVYERFDTRRRAFKHLTGLGQKLTAAALPGLVGALFNKAYGQGTGSLPADVVAVLNLALQLEYLEYNFYNAGLNTPGLIPASEVAAITTIRNDEAGHIKVLRQALGNQAFSQSDVPVTAFDYTGQGSFPDWNTNTAKYFGVAQSFVDTGVRAYKGGAPILINNKDILQAALNIHSVEARHSSHIRTVRRALASNAVGTIVAADPNDLNNKPKSWISGQDNGGAAPNATPVNTRPVYAAGGVVTVGSTPLPSPAEDNLMHAQFNAQTGSTAPTGLTITPAAASEAFDEPLDAATVKTIARNFRSAAGAALGLFNP
ncbi:ferritin-like domain-containing protein [Hymenobacter sp. CRA2]|uniref:ferritin-like domain-containing protein n=1 Tax=Hymenobacter sp. CRA2 TaxID=1955620 RepID=UPI00098F2B00|nr:ferritin-like domain-containing protein [Hymenobacter sp. CRA2]OON67930.1 hypothetical protein B0919_14760 [Hymenobacter sp. CRA2]